MSGNVFKSKFINKSINLNRIYDTNKDEIQSSSESESDSESEMDSNDKNLFIIDSKPENNLEIKPKKLNKNPIFGAKLDVDIKVNPYLSSHKTPEESLKLLDEMSLKSMNCELSRKTVIKSGFEQNYLINSFQRSKRLRKKINREERDKTLGDKWFGMKAQELTEEKKNDLLALNMRRGWDPKRFYKKNERKDLPKFFQIGTIIESKADFYHSRVPKKDRKRTLVEELLADADFRRYNKKKYSEALAQNPYYIRMKRRKQRQQMKAKGIDWKTRSKNKKIKREKQVKQNDD